MFCNNGCQSPMVIMLADNTPAIEIVERDSKIISNGELVTKFACPVCGETAIVYFRPYGIEWDDKVTRLK